MLSWPERRKMSSSTFSSSFSCKSPCPNQEISLTKLICQFQTWYDIPGNNPGVIFHSSFIHFHQTVFRAKLFASNEARSNFAPFRERKEIFSISCCSPSPLWQQMWLYRSISYEKLIVIYNDQLHQRNSRRKGVDCFDLWFFCEKNKDLIPYQ